MYVYLIFALQGYCVYHCYSNRNQYYWILLVLFIPIIGSLIYLFQHVIRKKDIDMVQNELAVVINPSKKITDLEKKLKFSKSFENQSALADAYLEAEMYDQAITNYETCLSGTFKNDFYVTSKLQEAYYFSTQFNESIQCAETILSNSKFKKSRSAFLYALALEKIGDIKNAEHYLSQFDAPYSRYLERLELAKFYIRNAKKTKADVLLNEMVAESEGMSKGSYKENRILIKKAKELLQAGL